MVGKKRKTRGLMALFSAHHFFATSNALPTSRSTSICHSTLTRFRAIRTSWTYWIPDARTTAVTGPPSTKYDFKTRVIGGSRSPHGYRTLCDSVEHHARIHLGRRLPIDTKLFFEYSFLRLPIHMAETHASLLICQFVLGDSIGFVNERSNLWVSFDWVMAHR